MNNRLIKNLCLIVLTSISLSTFAQEALMLFGGDNHNQFLGCINCSKYDSNSICNKYGDYGSKYSINSIWNQYGEYGSKYSLKSPWNQYSNLAPIIVNNNSNSYGYFTINKYHSNRTQIETLVKLLDFQLTTDDLEKTRNLFCGD